jgi:hypothetical protein
LLGAIYGADFDELLIEGGDLPIPGRDVPVTITAGARFGDPRGEDSAPQRRRA